MKVVLEAIYSKFAPAGAKPAFYTDMGGRLRLFTALQNEAYPFCTYTLIGNGLETWFDGETQELISVQFNIYANESSAQNITDYFEDLKTLYDECALSVTGWSHLRMERNWAYLLRDEKNNVWQYSVQYRIRIESD